MTAPYKTASEQKLEWFDSLRRPLTDDESDELRRAMHAVYARDRNLQRARRIEAEWRNPALLEHAEYERLTLAMVSRESLQPERLEEVR